MGVFQITPAFSTQVTDYGINDTSSRLKDVTAVVSATFAVADAAEAAASAREGPHR